MSLHTCGWFAVTFFKFASHLTSSLGDQLSAVYCCILHSSYMLVAMFLAGFMNVSLASRSFLLIVVPMNAVSEIKEGSSLSFGALTMLLLIFVLGQSPHILYICFRNLPWAAVNKLFMGIPYCAVCTIHSLASQGRYSVVELSIWKWVVT